MDHETRSALFSVVRSAGDTLASLWPGTLDAPPLEVKRKADGSIVTNADVISEAILLQGIRQLFPGEAILSEESGLTGPTPDEESLWWLVDPLDGTANFHAGRDSYAILLTRLRGGTSIFGLIYQPQQRKVLWGQHGKGAFLEDRSLHVSSCRDRSKARILTRNIDLSDPSFERGVSSAINIAQLACGEVDGAVTRFRSHKRWDIAPYLAIVDEAGGVMTDLSGAHLNFLHTLGSGFVASNGFIHGELIEAIERFEGR